MLETLLKSVLRTTSKHLKLLEDLGLQNVQDLLLYFPRAYTDASEITPLTHSKIGQIATFEGVLSNYFTRKTKSGKILTKALFTDQTGSIAVSWFHQPHIPTLLPPGEKVLLVGKPRFVMRQLTLQNPAGEIKTDHPLHAARIIPLYHETKGLTSKWLRGKIQPLIKKYIDALKDTLPPEIRAAYRLMEYKKAVEEAHFPSSEKNLEKAKKRLAFEEIFLLQLKACQKKWRWQHIAQGEEKKIRVDGEKIQKIFSQLPFILTNAQKRSLKEILKDLEKPFPMSRLLQGDVGSGKTVIAAIAIYIVIHNSYQVALMAPTEILAKQHYKTIASLLLPHGINIQLLLGSTGEKIKKDVYQSIATGTLDLVIGTHALIQEKVHFKKLGLAIIDEQHRFGVKQRDMLKRQASPHLLSLSATPIPRTLAMTIYGDQDLSIIDELPPGRKPIMTRIVPEEKRMNAYQWIKEQIREGKQAFIICPLIDESDVLEVKSVIQEYEYLKTHIFPELNVSFLHGKLRQEEKDEIMEKFFENEINILVSTSVIEVGIDVPNASIMIIEGAERFGLSQLHQFRGRVGRGEHQSYCFLFTNKETLEVTKRLRAMVQHQSGFKLAEIDLEIRGPGEIYGAKQSGIPDLKMASFSDSEIIVQARDAAQKIIQEDPLLEKFSVLKKMIEAREEIYIKD